MQQPFMSASYGFSTAFRCLTFTVSLWSQGGNLGTTIFLVWASFLIGAQKQWDSALERFQRRRGGVFRMVRFATDSCVALSPPACASSLADGPVSAWPGPPFLLVSPSSQHHLIVVPRPASSHGSCSSSLFLLYSVSNICIRQPAAPSSSADLYLLERLEADFSLFQVP